MAENVRKLAAATALTVVLLALGGTVLADDQVTIETVPIGHANNEDNAWGDGYGGVDYEFRVGKYEVTAGQYTAFLNAVAVTDTYGLYSTMMDSFLGCKIQRDGESGSYSYSVPADYVNRPVNYVSWADAARFANWLHNGQFTGEQDLTTTEDGAYYLNGATSNEDVIAVTREADWTWAITSEDEWVKAAYYDPATESYFEYPTSSNSIPGLDTTETTNPGNNANYYLGGSFSPILPPYWRTEAGEFELSSSPYGTFDQAGNLTEWTELVLYETMRQIRGGSFATRIGTLHVSNRGNADYPTNDNYGFGFRVSHIPEPASLALLAFGTVTMLTRRRNPRG